MKPKNTLNLHISNSCNSSDFYRITVGRNRRVSETNSICFTGDIPAESIERTIATIVARYARELDTPVAREIVITTDYKPNPDFEDHYLNSEIGDPVPYRISVVPYYLLDNLSVSFNTAIRPAFYRIVK